MLFTSIDAEMQVLFMYYSFLVQFENLKYGNNNV